MSKKNTVSIERRDNFGRNSSKKRLDILQKSELQFYDESLKEVTLGDICEFSKGKGILKNDLSDEGIPCIIYGELYTHYDEIISNIKSKTDLNKDNLVLSSKYDIIMPDCGETAIDLANASCILREDVAIGMDTIILKTKQNPIFLTYYIRYKRNEIAKIGQGSSIVHIYPKDLKKIKIKIPTLKKQNKISNFLVKVNEKINLMEQNYSLYVDIKKYFIENIFHDINEKSTDNCLINNVKWKQLKLKDIIKKGKAGGTPKSSVKKYYDGNIPFLSINDMTKEGKYITYTEKTMSELGLENSSAWIVPEKSLLYSIYASVGFVSINNIPLATSQAIFSIIFKDDVDLEFMYYYLTFYKKYIHRYIETGTQQNLKAETIKNFKIKIPPLEKQEKISKFLSSIDKYIQIYEQDLNNLKKYKKGLLQKMFI